MLLHDSSFWVRSLIFSTFLSLKHVLWVYYPQHKQATITALDIRSRTSLNKVNNDELVGVQKKPLMALKNIPVLFETDGFSVHQQIINGNIMSSYCTANSESLFNNVF